MHYETKELGNIYTRIMLGLFIAAFPVAFALIFSEFFFGEQYFYLGRACAIVAAALAAPFVFSLIYICLKKHKIRQRYCCLEINTEEHCCSSCCHSSCVDAHY